MKKALLLFASLTTLAACQSPKQTTSTHTKTSTAKVVKKEKDNSKPRDVGNAPLEKVGDYTTYDGAKHTLLAIYRPSGKHAIANNISVTIKDIKIIKLEDIKPNSSSDFMGFQDGDVTIQIFYNMDNQTDKTLYSIATPTIITSKGEQISPNNILGDYELLPKANTDTGCVEIIKDADISGITLNFKLQDENPAYNDLPTQPLEIKF